MSIGILILFTYPSKILSLVDPSRTKVLNGSASSGTGPGEALPFAT
jgi:hypothetical protein